MADTLGSLVDKLITVDLKLWHVQDRVHKAAAVGEGLDPETTGQLASLNLQRNGLMSELDEMFADGVKSGIVAVDPRIKLV